MVEALVISNIVLWVLVIALALLVFALTRQVGILHERVAPAGALRTQLPAAAGRKFFDRHFERFEDHGDGSLFEISMEVRDYRFLFGTAVAGERIPKIGMAQAKVDRVALTVRPRFRNTLLARPEGVHHEALFRTGQLVHR